MNIFKKFLAIIFAGLFVFSAVPALIFFNLDRRAFTAETYQKAFANEGFYNQLPTIMAEAMISSTTDQSGLPIVMRGMSTQAWESFFRAIIPPEALKEIGDNALSSMFAYLSMESNSAEISLAPLKASMVRDAGVQAVFTLLKTQPDCTLSQMGEMALGLLSEQEMLFCNPPEEITPLLTPIIQAQLQVASAAIPNQITLASTDGTNDPRERLQTLRLFMRLSPLLPLGFLLLLTIFAVNSLNSWLKWWGIPFIITGVIASLMSLGGAPILGVILEGLLVNRMPAFFSAIFLNYASEISSAMLQALLRPVLWQGLVIAGIGFVMVVGSYFFNQKK